MTAGQVVMSMPLNDYEQERERRIAQNNLKLQELGVLGAVQTIRDTVNRAAPVARQRKRKAPAEATDSVRRSSRGVARVSYCEREITGPRERGFGYRAKWEPITEEDAAELRKAAERKGVLKASRGRRGPQDSGKGVRLQGGRVYDSKYGVTCHWCRQKTLEEKVTCTHPTCGGGRKMPVSFCKMCLWNRHGENVDAAEASGCWVCPCCRGSCGIGCISCCNCGPCRKKAQLEPTGQVKGEALRAGFSNAHDYLVYLTTGESAEQLQQRKFGFTWGQWLAVAASPPSDPESPASTAARVGAVEGAYGATSDAPGDLDLDHRAVQEAESQPAMRQGSIKQHFRNAKVHTDTVSKGNGSNGEADGEVLLEQDANARKPMSRRLKAMIKLGLAVEGDSI